MHNTARSSGIFQDFWFCNIQQFCQANLSLRWAHMPFAGFVMRWLMYICSRYLFAWCGLHDQYLVQWLHDPQQLVILKHNFRALTISGLKLCFRIINLVNFFTLWPFFSPKLLIFFLFLHESICCWYSLEAPNGGASNEYPQYMFLWRNKKNGHALLISTHNRCFYGEIIKKCIILIPPLTWNPSKQAFWENICPDQMTVVTTLWNLK